MIYFVKIHPNDKNCIRLINISTSIELSRDSDSYSYTYKYKINYYMDFIPGKINKVYKNLKVPKEVSAVEGLIPNSGSIHFYQFIYEDAVGTVDFLYTNQSFTRKSCLDLIFENNNDIDYSDSDLLFVYLILINEYPIIEQFLKMGYYDLVERLIRFIFDGQTLNLISERINKINKLVYKGATEGKKGLRLPSYIQDYLVNRKSPLIDYFLWVDIYAVTRISKENFEELIHSKEYIQMQFYYRKDLIPNILEYGYTIKQLLKYLFKQTFNTDNKYFHPVELLNDYLNMCDMLNIKADKYPQDIKKAHDDIMSIMNNQKLEAKNEENKRKLELMNKKIEKIALSCEAILSEHKDEEKTEFQKEYTNVFPKTVNDFIQEGINQRNCVGSYAKKVANNKTIVFFVRKKDDPEKSFITAECYDGKLYQCKYICNIQVKNGEILTFLKSIAKNLKKYKLRRHKSRLFIIF